MDTGRLPESFFKALRAHPDPVSEPAPREGTGDSTARNACVWLAYRLHACPGPTPICWASLAVYREARVDITDDGRALHPSVPPIAKLRIASPGTNGQSVPKPTGAGRANSTSR